MRTRSAHMRSVNTTRSNATKSIINFLNVLEDGSMWYNQFYLGELDRFGVKDYQKLKGQLNSYRANKICQFLGKNINKQKLTKYSKPKDYEYQLTTQDIYEWLDEYKEPIYKYVNFMMGIGTGGTKSLD